MTSQFYSYASLCACVLLLSVFVIDGSAAGAGESSPAPAFAVRSDFNPLAVFAPNGLTDEKGYCNFDYKLPDNLTSYHVWVVAVTEAQYGLGKGYFQQQLKFPRLLTLRLLL